MTSATRTDVHSPKNLVTEDYEYVTCFDNQQQGRQGSGGMWFDTKSELLAFLTSSSPIGERGIRQCHHCGARFRYFAVMLHVPTGHHLAIGETCLENRFERATADFHRLRKAAELDRAKQRVKAGIEAFLAEHADLAFMADETHEHRNGFLRDLSWKLRKYGSLSERQLESARKVIRAQAESDARKAAEALEPKSPVPTGKSITVEGTVVSVKWHESYYGASLKMVVKGDGWKVWGTVPMSLEVEAGDRVRFVASVEQSDGDESFGFFKRPRKAEVLAEAA